MPRGPRICYPGAVLHIINRFIDRHPFFKVERDYDRFLEIYFDEAKSAGLLTFAYNLLPNHFHFLVQVPSGEISSFLRRFMSRAARNLNNDYDRLGHLFQGRSKTLVVDSKSYFDTVTAYVLLNGVRAGLAPDVFSWKWGSAREMLKKKDCRLARRELWPYLFGSDFDERSPENAIRECRQWLSNIGNRRHEQRFVDNHHGGFLSSKEFRERILKEIERRKSGSRLGKMRKTDRRDLSSTWAEICSMATEAANCREAKRLWRSQEVARRQMAWYLAYVGAHWTLKRIQHDEDRVCVSPSAIAMAIKNIRESAEKRALGAKCLKMIGR